MFNNAKEPIHIMTSCDDNLLTRLSVLLQSIADNLSHRLVHFYLFQSCDPGARIELLKRQCSIYGNIVFHHIKVPDTEPYEVLAGLGNWQMSELETINGGGGLGWCKEAYFSLGAYQLLPQDIDRILYLDAGDILVVDDIEPYYNGDFEGKSLLVTGTKYKGTDDDCKLLDSDDLMNPQILPTIIQGIFNSGSYVMNLNKMRRDACQMEDYIRLASQLKQISVSQNRAFLGDQGLLSAAYVGDVKYYGYPEIVDLWYMPYNFCMWYFDCMKTKPHYRPGIIHYAGANLAFKPWRGKYPIFLERFQNMEELYDLNQLELGQAEYYYLWHEYAMKAEKTLQLCLE